MMITTFLHDYEMDKFQSVTDKDLNYLLQEVRGLNPKYLLQERTFTTKRFARKAVHTTLYQLYAVHRSDVQVVNFFQEGASSINTYVPKSLIMAYFYGLLTDLTPTTNE